MLRKLKSLSESVELLGVVTETCLLRSVRPWKLARSALCVLEIGTLLCVLYVTLSPMVTPDSLYRSLVSRVMGAELRPGTGMYPDGPACVVCLFFSVVSAVWMIQNA